MDRPGDVFDSAWRQDSSERDAPENLALRLEARMLVGVRALKLEKRALSIQATIRIDIYVLWNRLADAFTSSGDRRAQPGAGPAGPHLRTLEAGIDEDSSEAYGIVIAQERDRGLDDETRLVGYHAAERDRTRQLLTTSCSRTPAPRTRAATRFVATAFPHDPVPSLEELERTFAALGIQAWPARREGTRITFAP